MTSASILEFCILWLSLQGLSTGWDYWDKLSLFLPSLSLAHGLSSLLSVSLALLGSPQWTHPRSSTTLPFKSRAYTKIWSLLLLQSQRAWKLNFNPTTQIRIILPAHKRSSFMALFAFCREAVLLV